MKIVKPEQMGEVDKFTINEIGIPGIVLMENAAVSVVNEVLGMLPDLSGRRIIVLAGKGNNGGDALAVARHLYNKGIDVRTFLLAKKDEVKGDAETNLKILENMGIDIVEFISEGQFPELENVLEKADIVVDGIFGTGLKGNVRGIPARLIDIVNSSLKTVVSIDIPSGINGENGKIMGCCIRASSTVTFALPKIGLLVHPGCEYTGKIVVADIGIPQKAIEHFQINTQILSKCEVSSLIPVRSKDANKGSFGRVFIISGSKGMTGAGCLTAKAALRSGAGLVYIGVPSSLWPIYASSTTEAITIPLDDDGNGRLSHSLIDKIDTIIEKKDVIAIGPGLSVNDAIIEIVESIIKKARVPLVIDADALNAISTDVSVLKHLKVPAVLTPHPGEMSRLTGIDIAYIQKNRLEVAREFAARWNVITVLKGSRTIVAKPDGTLFLNTTGNPGMATAGSGDVLTGIIASLIGQKMIPEDAAVAGVYIHGLAGDEACGKKGECGMIAGDIVEELPGTLRSLGR